MGLNEGVKALVAPVRATGLLVADVTPQIAAGCR
jgi:hypothetical protein